MDKNNHKQALSNKATITAGEKVSCENCSEKLLFHLHDNFHEFTLGMTTILQCLRFAEDKGAVPKLPSEWWIAAERYYEMDRICQEE